MYGKRRYSYCYLGNDRAHSAPRRGWASKGHAGRPARLSFPKDFVENVFNERNRAGRVGHAAMHLASGWSGRFEPESGPAAGAAANLGPLVNSLRWGALGYWLVAVVLIVAIGRGPALGLLSAGLGWAAVIPGMVLTAEPSYQ